MGNITEAYRYFRNIGRHAFAGPQIERNTLPAPVVYVHFQSSIRFRIGMPVHIRLIAIARHMNALYPALGILAPCSKIRYRLAGDRAQRVQHIHFFAANIVCVIGNRRLHRHQAQQLEQMVLHHVAQCTGMFVVASAFLNAQRLRNRDGHMVHIAAVPDRLEDRIGKTHGEDVLHGLLAEEVIDTEYLLFTEELGQNIIDRAERIQVMAQWFFNNDAHVLAVPRKIGRSQTLNDSIKQGRRYCQIKHLFRFAIPVFIAR